MQKQTMPLGMLKTLTPSMDRAEMRDLYARKDGEQDYLYKRFMGVWNITQNRPACIAPKNYVTIQHARAIEAVIDALATLNIKGDATIQSEKHRVIVDIDFPEVKVELKEVGESFTSGIRIVSDYAQYAGLFIGPRVTRLACSNGMIITDVIKAHRIKYHDELAITMEGIIEKIIDSIIDNDDKLANMVSICMRDSVEWQTCKLLLLHMVKRKKLIKQIISRIGQKERVTRWDLYNAFTNYATHGQRLKPSVESWLQNKAQKILTNSFEKMCEVEIPVRAAAASPN